MSDSPPDLAVRPPTPPAPPASPAPPKRGLDTVAIAKKLRDDMQTVLNKQQLMLEGVYARQQQYDAAIIECEKRIKFCDVLLAPLEF